MYDCVKAFDFIFNIRSSDKRYTFWKAHSKKYVFQRLLSLNYTKREINEKVNVKHGGNAAVGRWFECRCKCG